MAVLNLLAESRSAKNKEARNTLVVEFLSEDHAAVSAEAEAAAVWASATEVKCGNIPSWRLDDEYASRVPFDVISSRSTLPGPGSADQRVARPSVHHSYRLEKTVWAGHEGGSSPQGLYAELAATVEDQSRGEAVWGCHPRRSGTCGTEATTGATRRGRLAR